VQQSTDAGVASFSDQPAFAQVSITLWQRNSTIRSQYEILNEK
jgi:hypothetical protein